MATWVRTLLVTALATDVEPWVPEHLRHLRDLKAQGRDAVTFYTDQRVVVSRWS